MRFTRPGRSARERVVVLVTPFTSLVSMPVPVAKEIVLFEMTVLVASTPLIVVVSTLPVKDCVKEFMMLAATEAMPFTVAVSVLASDVRTFEVIDVVVATIPFTVDVIILSVVEAVFVISEATPSDDVATQVGVPFIICNTVPVAPGENADAIFETFPTSKLPNASGIFGRTEKVVVLNVVVPVTVRSFRIEIFVPVALPKIKLSKFALVENKFVVVAFVATRFVKNPDKAVIKEENKLVVVAFVVVAFVPIKLKLVIVPVALMSPVEVAIEYKSVVVPDIPLAPAGPVAPVEPTLVPSPIKNGTLLGVDTLALMPLIPATPLSPFCP